MYIYIYLYIYIYVYVYMKYHQLVIGSDRSYVRPFTIVRWAIFLYHFFLRLGARTGCGFFIIDLETKDFDLFCILLIHQIGVQ